MKWERQAPIQGSPVTLTGVGMKNCERWPASCWARIGTPSSFDPICHPSRLENVWCLESSSTLNCSSTLTPSTWWAPQTKGPWATRNFLPSTITTSKSPCWWEKWPWMPVSMWGCKKKDNYKKKWCATLWFAVKFARLPLMDDPPSGNKTMCLWAGSPIEW